MSGQSVNQNKVVSFVYSIVDDSGELLEQSDIPISYVHGGKHDLFEKVELAMDGAVVGDGSQEFLPHSGYEVDDAGGDIGSGADLGE